MKARTLRLLAYIVERGKEPSTWRGLALLLTVAGVKMKPEHGELILLVGLGIAGLIGAALPDRKE